MHNQGCMRVNKNCLCNTCTHDKDMCCIEHTGDGAQIEKIGGPVYQCKGCVACVDYTPQSGGAHV